MVRCIRCIHVFGCTSLHVVTDHSFIAGCSFFLAPSIMYLKCRIQLNTCIPYLITLLAGAGGHDEERQTGGSRVLWSGAVGVAAGEGWGVCEGVLEA